MFREVRRPTQWTSCACGLALVMLLMASPGSAQAISAYLPSDFGDTTDLVARMEAFGWTVTTTPTLDLEGEDPYAAFDVIWILSDASDYAVEFLRDPVGDLSRFAQNGGVLVIIDVSGEEPDLATGGIDVMGLPDGGAGTVTIAAADHPLITGAGIGGVALTEADLDPEAAGGRGYLAGAPEGATVIAENSAGATLLEYAYGAGHVIVCALLNPSAACTDNILLYAESLVS